MSVSCGGNPTSGGDHGCVRFPSPDGGVMAARQCRRAVGAGLLVSPDRAALRAEHGEGVPLLPRTLRAMGSSRSPFAGQPWWRSQPIRRWALATLYLPVPGSALPSPGSSCIAAAAGGSGELRDQDTRLSGRPDRSGIAPLRRVCPSYPVPW